MSPPIPNRRQRAFFWSGLVIIIVLNCLYYAFFLYGISLHMPLHERHVFKFLFAFSVYLTGALCLRGFAASWMRRVWHFVYLLVLVLLVGLGAYDWLVSRTWLGLRELADNLQEFLVSPLLYVAVGILGRRMASDGAGS